MSTSNCKYHIQSQASSPIGGHTYNQRYQLATDNRGDLVTHRGHTGVHIFTHNFEMGVKQLWRVEWTCIHVLMHVNINQGIQPEEGWLKHSYRSTQGCTCLCLSYAFTFSNQSMGPQEGLERVNKERWHSFTFLCSTLLLLCVYHITVYYVWRLTLLSSYIHFVHIQYNIYFQYIIFLLCYYMIKWYMFHPQQFKTLQMHPAKQSYTLYHLPFLHSW